MKKIIQDEKLLELHSQGLNDSQMANYFNCTIGCVTMHRRAMGLELNVIHSFDTNEYLRLYNEGHSDLEIGRIMNTDYRKLSDYRHKLKLKAYKIPARPITDLQYSVIVGTVLGDGHLRKPFETWNTILNFGHSIKQREYFLYKYKLLENLFNGYNEYPTLDKRTNTPGFFINASTVHNENLNELHSLFYKDKEKVITKEIFKYFTDLSLAIFFCDDGFRSQKSGYNLCMNNFSTESINVFIEFMKDRYNIECNCFKSHVVYIPVRYKDVFTNIISPYIIESMQYKLHYVSSINSLNSVNTHSNMDNTEPSISLND